jgi:hypothetical protein
MLTGFQSFSEPNIEKIPEIKSVDKDADESIE